MAGIQSVENKVFLRSVALVLSTTLLEEFAVAVRDSNEGFPEVCLRK